MSGYLPASRHGAVLASIAVALLVLFLFAGRTVHAYEGHDTALWTEIGLRYKLQKRWGLDWRGYWRIDDHISATDKVMEQVALRFRATDHLRFVLGYRHIQEAKRDGDFETAHRFFFDTTVRESYKELVFSYRLRLHHQREEGADDPEHRVRNKIRVQWKASKLVRPLISTEHFLTEGEGWVSTRTRSSVGVDLNLDDHVVSLLYRLNWPIDEQDDPLTHILGLGYGYEW